MKVLFVSSGNSAKGMSPIIKAQGESLIQAGVEVDYFTIKGRGLLGYLKNTPKLRKVYKKGGYNLCHAHYSSSAYVATFAGIKPLVVSLMGSDVRYEKRRFLVRYFVKHFWQKTIVKSEAMKRGLGINSVEVIPNGVDLEVFKPIDRKKCLERLGWDKNKKHIFFAASPKREVKNYPLAERAFQLLKRDDLELHPLLDVPHSEMVYYFNASEVTLLTSKYEGSPNVIKEAMASNSVVVSTDVGDVAERFGNAKGAYLCEHNEEDIAEKLRAALDFKEGPETRNKVSNLDSKIIAKRLVDIYKKV